jgi:membrane protein DedA with SNARE-associated domain
MLDFVRSIMNYPGIAFLMFLENVFPPLPSELIMPLAGFNAGAGKITLWGAILAGAVGSLLGQLPLYYLGKLAGEERLKRWADKYGAWLTVSSDEIEHSKKWFEDHGTKAVLLGRLVPGIRSLVSVPAGMANMPLPKFLAYSAVGTSVWAGLLAFLGYQLGERYELVEKYLGPVTYVVLGGIGLYLAYSIYKRKKSDKGKGGQKGGKPAPAH